MPLPHELVGREPVRTVRIGCSDRAAKARFGEGTRKQAAVRHVASLNGDRIVLELTELPSSAAIQRDAHLKAEEKSPRHIRTQPDGTVVGNHSADGGGDWTVVEGPAIYRPE